MFVNNMFLDGVDGHGCIPIKQKQVAVFGHHVLIPGLKSNNQD